MLYSFFLVCTFDLLFAAVLLVGLGAAFKFRSRLLALATVVALASAAGAVVEHLFSVPPGYVRGAVGLQALVGAAVVLVRPDWNPIGQLFLASYLAATLTYLSFAAEVTLAGGLSFRGALASAALFVLELSALVLASSFVFETCDVICRVRHSRIFPTPDPDYLPRVSLHIAAYNEPPDMLIETIRSVEAIEYPNFEVVVVDNNTEDERVWRPVQEYCRDRPNVRFVHVNPWPGYKSGALNLALDRYTDPAAEIVGVVDADYLVDPGYLQATVGYFADPKVAFVQTPQDYRDYEGSTYFTACYDAYRYFFATAMPSRNERNSIIFAGTMGLLRRSRLGEIGGWDEWCITEDAETSLRLLKAGYEGMFVSQSFGRGIMPLTFASLKSQRFRWCFGGMQILRSHWRSLMPWDRSPENHLAVGQRLDYLFGGLQWINDLILLLFSIVLLVMAGLLIDGQHVAIRPLVGPTIALPAVLIFTGLLRALWALKVRDHISYRRAFLAFASWLSLSFTVARACVQGLVRSEGVFLRTPKVGGAHKLRAAFVAARTETLLALVLWGSAIALTIVANPTPLLVGLVAWQGAVYVTSPTMSWLAQRAHLTPDLERRRRSEERRERFVAVLKPVAFGTSAALGGASAVLIAVLALGAGNAGHPANPFNVPNTSPSRPVPHSPANPTTTTTAPATSTTATTTPGPSGSSTTTPPPTSATSSTTATTSPSTTGPSTTTAPTSTVAGTTNPAGTSP
jgi:cellulose synthase/poly-beta-1,6-N-acetylglucosamine synthase-like glycosyltransferase